MPKRGENIRKRKDGRWEGRFIKDRSPDGKAKYASVYGKSSFEVKKKLTEALDTQNTMASSGRSKELCFREVLFLWLQNNKIKLRPQTHSKYAYLIESHIIPKIGSCKLTKLNSVVINGFLEEKSASGRLDGKGGLSASYVKTIAFIINSAIELAVSERLRQPLYSEIIKPSSKKKELEVLNIREQAILENYIITNLDSSKLGVLICLHVGLRIGEICGLKWNDFDFNNNTVHIRRTIERIKNMNREKGEPKTILVEGETKTISSDRILPVPSYLLDSLQQVMASSNSDYVIDGATHDFIDPRTYQYRFHKYLDDCKIRGINFHALRHTFATRCIEVGVDIKTLSELLGHASVNITLNTYVHSSMEMKRNQIEMLSSIRGQ